MTRVSKTIRHFPATVLIHRSRSILAPTLVLLDRLWSSIVVVLVLRLAAMSDDEESE